MITINDKEYAVRAEVWKKECELDVKLATIDEFKLIKAVDLKDGDIIIHNYSRFVIDNCGPGFGAGNEFGHYFWIKGHYLKSLRKEDFWSFQKCPVILCL